MPHLRRSVTAPKMGTNGVQPPALFLSLWVSFLKEICVFCCCCLFSNKQPGPVGEAQLSTLQLAAATNPQTPAARYTP